MQSSWARTAPSLGLEVFALPASLGLFSLLLVWDSDRGCESPEVRFAPGSQMCPLAPRAVPGPLWGHRKYYGMNLLSPTMCMSLCHGQPGSWPDLELLFSTFCEGLSGLLAVGTTPSLCSSASHHACGHREALPKCLQGSWDLPPSSPTLVPDPLPSPCRHGPCPRRPG